MSRAAAQTAAQTAAAAGGRDGVGDALERLRAYIEGEAFAGHDPYDALNARVDFSRLGRWGPILAIQLQKRSPLDLRRWLGIEKQRNPKAIGLLLHAYALLYDLDPAEETAATARALFEWLRDHAAEGYSGAGWGYPFDWASPAKYLKAHVPSVVVTGFVGRGLCAYYEVFGDERVPPLMRSACEFVLRDLPVVERPEGLCFSYTPIATDLCYNASLLGAELLARTAALTGDEALLEPAVRAVDFVLARQHADGHWGYSLDPETGRERRQIDFHQGFVLDSLRAFAAYAGAPGERVGEAVRKGLDFYWERQFTPEGRSRWRLPAEWPVDIHHQAQGILTFARSVGDDAAWLGRAEAVARWTLGHLWDERGYFYYRKGRWLTNKIAYLRWGQAWMMLALSTLRQARAAERAGAAGRLRRWVL